MTSSLELRSISDLLNERFIIPAYQRGYRWTERQVTELLDDLHEFGRDSDSLPKEAFYCLQPVVVLPCEDGSWELIDGQQRLTTLFLVMGALGMVMQMLGKQRYEIRYETRPRSGQFLTSLSAEQAEENIDFHHLYRAHAAIEAWFAAHDGTVKLNLLNRLLAPQDRNVKVIWYQLPQSEDPVQVFIRLNVGKIPLTNAELIRALFLRDRNFGSPSAAPSRIQVAQEWDALEKRLQHNPFWYFLHDGADDYAARIEYLFEIKVQELGLERPAHDDYRTFIAYQYHFLEGASVESTWREVRQLAQRLEEWYGDRTLYHLVGYWIATSPGSSGEVIVELLRRRRSSTRTDFDQHLRGLIFEHLVRSPINRQDREDVVEVLRERLGNLTYDRSSDKTTIRAVLLLFNIATLLRNTGSNLRFPFDLFKPERWDIEHVRSVRSEMPGRVDDRKAWLAQVVRYWNQPELGGSGERSLARDALRNDAQALLSAEVWDDGAFEDLYDRLLTHFEEALGSEADHGLANLTLLDDSTNRAYKNAVFPVKRRWILELDKKGTFVPLCTTNVFLKYYSGDIEQMMFWRADDGKRYFEAIVEMLGHFFTGEGV